MPRGTGILYIHVQTRTVKRTSRHPSSISLSNVSFCVPILGTKNVTCLSDGTALHGFQKEHSLIHFLRGLAAPVIWKVRVLCYEFTDVTLAWEDGQWVEAHKIILAGCSPKKAPQPSCLSWMVLILMSRKQKRKRQTGHVSGCPKLVLWMRQLKRGAGEGTMCPPPSPVSIGLSKLHLNKQGANKKMELLGVYLWTTR